MSHQIFADFPDHRVTGHCVYSISDLLTISLLTHLCGGGGLRGHERVAHVRRRSFGLLSDNDTSPPRHVRAHDVGGLPGRDAPLPVRARQVVPVLARREAGGDDRQEEAARHRICPLSGCWPYRSSRHTMTGGSSGRDCSGRLSQDYLLDLLRSAKI